MKYQYLTVLVRHSFGLNSLANQIQDVLNEKAELGWRLHRLETIDRYAFTILIFEKEVEEK